VLFGQNLVFGENEADLVMQASLTLRSGKPDVENSAHQPRLPILAKDIEAEPIAEP